MIQDGTLTLDDVNCMSWDEFGNTFEALHQSISTYCAERGVAFDIIVPILRSGGITGCALAIRLAVLAVLPVQFTRLKGSDDPKQLLSFPSILTNVPKVPRILICESNTDRGEIAKCAIELVLSKYPNAQLYYATLTRVFGGPTSFEGVERYFFGRETNERFVASPADVAALNLRLGMTIFPWERAEDELAQLTQEVAAQRASSSGCG
jgi:hypoxanthine phosphoribosyltransferase